MLALVCLPLCAPQPQAGTALLPLPLAPLALLAMAAVAPAVASMRKPPLGFSSWNNVGMEVSAPMLLEVADAMTSSGLREAGYIYINTDDGWNAPERDAAGGLQPCSHFTNGKPYGCTPCQGLQVRYIRSRWLHNLRPTRRFPVQRAGGRQAVQGVGGRLCVTSLRVSPSTCTCLQIQSFSCLLAKFKW